MSESSLAFLDHPMFEQECWLQVAASSIKQEWPVMLRGAEVRLGVYVGLC